MEVRSAGPSHLSSSTPTTEQPTLDQERATSPSPGSSKTAASKWHNPLGPPPGSTFGARILGDQDPFSQNAWDHVELPEDFHERAAEILDRQRSAPVAEDRRDAYNEDPAKYWNKFYSFNKDQFFKDRAWLRLEFPELIACSEADGAGNTIFTLLTHNENPDLVVHATDYSARAVEVVKSNLLYPRPSHGKGVLHASVWDITASTPHKHEPADPTATNSSFCLPEGVALSSVDVITCIYVLSALHPSEWEQAIRNLYTALKPGGLLLIRDYGRHDLAQLRMKKERLLDPQIPNLYIRGDGTRAYFFTQEEFEGMLTRKECEGGRGLFALEQLGEDRRMLVNRKERLTMFRIWLQVKARKLDRTSGEIGRTQAVETADPVRPDA